MNQRDEGTTADDGAGGDAWRNDAPPILFLVGACRLTDRTIIAYLLEPIKKQFAFSDTEPRLMSWIAFAAFFAIAGLPMGYVADRVTAAT